MINKEKKKNKVWTKEEEKFILDFHQTYGIKTLMKKFKCTDKQIKDKLFHLIGTKDFNLSGDMLTTGDIYEAFGIHYETTRQHMLNGKLPFEYDKSVLHLKKRLIHKEDFWNWLKENPKLLWHKKINRNIIIPEPDWLDDFLSEVKQTEKKIKWTPDEDALLIHYAEVRGLKHRETAELLGRSLRAIEKRYVRVSKKRMERNKKKGSNQ